MQDIPYAPLFESVYEYAKYLDDAARGRVLMACCAYAFEGVLPELDGMERTIFEQTARPSIDRTIAKYEANKRRNRSKKATEDVQTAVEEGATQTEAESPNDLQRVSNASPNDLQRSSNSSPTQLQFDSEGTSEGCKNELRPKTKDQRPKTEEQGPKNEDQGTSSVGVAPHTPVEGKAPRKKFNPPSPADVQEYGSRYVVEKGISGSFTQYDADQFCDYFAAQGWRLSNGNPMKDWQAATRNWIARKHPEMKGAEDVEDIFSKYA